MGFPVAALRAGLVAALAAFVVAWPIAARASAVAQHEHYRAELVPESRAPAPGRTLTMALHIALKPGWHIYWSNPGDTGYAPAVSWTMPPGFTAGPVVHPAPVRLVLAGLASFVHEGDTVLLQDLRLPDGLAAGTALPLTAHLDLLVCSESACVPDPVDLDMALTSGTGAHDSGASALFTRARGALPKSAGQGAEYAVTPHGLEVIVPGLTSNQVAFFVEQPGAVKSTAAVTAKAVAGGVQITVLRGDGDIPAVLSGVVTGGGQSFAF